MIARRHRNLHAPATGPILALLLLLATTQSNAGPQDPARYFNSFAAPHAVAVSADGARVAVGGWRMVRIVDANTELIVQSLPVPGATVTRLDFAPGGDRLMARLESWPNINDTIRFWDLDTGEALPLLPDGVSRVESAAWSHDGLLLVTGHADNGARVRDAESGAALRLLGGHGGAVRAVAVSPDGARVLTGATDGAVRVWTTDTGVLERTVDAHGAAVSALAFNLDGTEAISAGEDGTVRIWDPATGAEHRQFDLASPPVPRLALSPDARFLVADGGGMHPRLQLWDYATGVEPIPLVPASWQAPAAGAFLPDANTLLTVSPNAQRLDWWDLTTFLRTGTIEGHHRYFQPTTLLYAPDGKHLISGGGVDTGQIPPGISPFNDNMLRQWDTATARHEFLNGFGGPVNTAFFTPDRRYLYAGGGDALRIMDRVTGEWDLVTGGLSDDILAAALSPSGERLVLVMSNNTLRFYNAGTRAFLGLVSTDPITRAAFSPDSAAVLTNEAVPGDSANIVLRDPGSGLVSGVLGAGMPRSAVIAFSPDRRLLAASAGTTLHLWDWDTRAIVRSFEAHAQPVAAVAFSPNGRLLATGTAAPAGAPPGEFYALHLWDLETGEELRKFTVFPVRSIAFSPNGERIAAGIDAPLIPEWDISDINPFLVGDVNGDGVVNAVDVQLVINAALGVEISTDYNPDRNFDGLVNAADVQLVINDSLGATD